MKDGEQRPRHTPVAQIGAATAGGALILVGIVLLVLPGPGLLLVLAGVVVLARQFPAAERYVAPVRRRALDAARDSVATTSRIALSSLTAAALVAAGVVWGMVPWLPFAGWATGSSLILSGLLLVAVLVYSYRISSRPRAGTVGR